MSGNSQTALLGWNRSFGGRLFTTGLLIGLTMPVYMWINHTVAPRFDLGLPVDASIPFLPWTIFVYLSFYLLLLTAAALSTPRDYSRIQKTVLAANFICYAGFFLVPAHYPRPLPQTAGALEGIYTWLYSNDAPGNTFPSIHAAASLCVGFGMKQWPFALWGLAVAVSILTVKQHFVLDLLGGALVAAFSAWMVRFYESKTA
jgi:membrane-associated phospholipid phosphatase